MNRSVSYPLSCHLSNQGMFAGVVRQYECLHAQRHKAARQAEQLFGALLDRAFRGEVP